MPSAQGYQKRPLDSLGTGVMEGTEPPRGCWELNQGPLEEHPVPLTALWPLLNTASCGHHKPFLSLSYWSTSVSLSPFFARSLALSTCVCPFLSLSYWSTSVSLSPFFARSLALSTCVCLFLFLSCNCVSSVCPPSCWPCLTLRPPCPPFPHAPGLASVVSTLVSH